MESWKQKLLHHPEEEKIQNLIRLNKAHVLVSKH